MSKIDTVTTRTTTSVREYFNAHKTNAENLSKEIRRENGIRSLQLIKSIDSSRESLTTTGEKLKAHISDFSEMVKSHHEMFQNDLIDLKLIIKKKGVIDTFDKEIKNVERLLEANVERYEKWLASEEKTIALFLSEGRAALEVYIKCSQKIQAICTNLSNTTIATTKEKIRQAEQATKEQSIKNSTQEIKQIVTNQRQKVNNAVNPWSSSFKDFEFKPDAYKALNDPLFSHVWSMAYSKSFEQGAKKVQELVETKKIHPESASELLQARHEYAMSTANLEYTRTRNKYDAQQRSVDMYLWYNRPYTNFMPGYYNNASRFNNPFQYWTHYII